jgi:hypothetical protein
MLVVTHFVTRRDLAGVVHYEMEVPGRQLLERWTPCCQPNKDWLILTDDIVKDGMPTCLWCIARSWY